MVDASLLFLKGFQVLDEHHSDVHELNHSLLCECDGVGLKRVRLRSSRQSQHLQRSECETLCAPSPVPRRLPPTGRPAWSVGSLQTLRAYHASRDLTHYL